MELITYLDELHDDPSLAIRYANELGIGTVALRQVGAYNIINYNNTSKLCADLHKNNIKVSFLNTSIGKMSSGSINKHLSLLLKLPDVLNTFECKSAKIWIGDIGEIDGNSNKIIQWWLDKISESSIKHDYIPLVEPPIYYIGNSTNMCAMMHKYKRFMMIYDDPSIRYRGIDPIIEYYLILKDRIKIVELGGYNNGFVLLGEDKSHKPTIDATYCIDSKLGNRYCNYLTKLDIFKEAWNRATKLLKETSHAVRH